MEIILAPKVLQIVQELAPGTNVEVALQQVVENEIRRRLAMYELTDRTFCRKYNMTLAEFEAANIIEQHKYSFEIENDHQDWDQAVDGIETMRNMLHRLEEQGNVHVHDYA